MNLDWEKMSSRVDAGIFTGHLKYSAYGIAASQNPIRIFLVVLHSF
jgi:hypothetical protein